ncbi:hypothetical protein [Anaerosporobacter sp.]|uniref:hypothetical protein n=1 Tax=Anaerosporobacter sp. TaxID=1872529 RepID=UPI00286F1BF4|nr:hypothetical protein [Anaerosporobacter sp.]
MKKIIFGVIVCSILLLSACNVKISKDSNTESSVTNQNNEISKTENETSEKDKTEANPDNNITAEHDDSSSLPIDIEYVSYDDTAEWKDTAVKLGEYSVNIPEEWGVVDGTEYGLLNGAFFVPPEVDQENFRFNSHVAVEISEEPLYGGAAYDYSLESIQKDFFASMIVSTFSKMGGLSDLKFSVWNNNGSYIYIVDFMRSNETITMYQTTYYVMYPDKTILVYATTFGEDSVIPVHEAACHLINNLPQD